MFVSQTTLTWYNWLIHWMVAIFVFVFRFYDKRKSNSSKNCANLSIAISILCAFPSTIFIWIMCQYTVSYTTAQHSNTTNNSVLTRFLYEYIQTHTRISHNIKCVRHAETTIWIYSHIYTYWTWSLINANTLAKLHTIDCVRLHDIL